MDPNQPGPSTSTAMLIPNQSQDATSDSDFGIGPTVPPAQVSPLRSRGRARKQSVPRQPPPQYDSQLHQALAAGSPNFPAPAPPPPTSRRARARGAASPRCRGQRGTRGTGRGQSQRGTAPSSTTTSRLVYPVPDCCVVPSSSTAGPRAPGTTGLDHVDSPCISCSDEGCVAGAPTTEDLFAIPTEELVPMTDPLYNFIPGGMSGCNDLDELIDFSIYLGTDTNANRNRN